MIDIIQNKKGKMVTVEQTETYQIPCVSRVYEFASNVVPMQSYSELSIEVPDTLAHPEQLYLTNLDGSGAVSNNHYEAGGLGKNALVSGRAASARVAAMPCVAMTSSPPSAS